MFVGTYTPARTYHTLVNTGTHVSAEVKVKTSLWPFTPMKSLQSDILPGIAYTLPFIFGFPGHSVSAVFG